MGLVGKIFVVNVLMGWMVGRVEVLIGLIKVEEIYCLKLLVLEREILIIDILGILEVGVVGRERG